MEIQMPALLPMGDTRAQRQEVSWHLPSLACPDQRGRNPAQPRQGAEEHTGFSFSLREKRKRLGWDCPVPPPILASQEGEEWWVGGRERPGCLVHTCPSSGRKQHSEEEVCPLRAYLECKCSCFWNIFLKFVVLGGPHAVRLSEYLSTWFWVLESLILLLSFLL